MRCKIRRFLAWALPGTYLYCQRCGADRPGDWDPSLWHVRA
jgi:hypothetical protein